MDLLNAYYVLACVFGLGLAAIAAYGTWVKPDFLRDKSAVPLTLVSVLLFAATLGSAIAGAIEEGQPEEEPPLAQSAKKAE
jgi:hypothetical protein